MPQGSSCPYGQMGPLSNPNGLDRPFCPFRFFPGPQDIASFKPQRARQAILPHNGGTRNRVTRNLSNPNGLDRPFCHFRVSALKQLAISFQTPTGSTGHFAEYFPIEVEVDRRSFKPQRARQAILPCLVRVHGNLALELSNPNGLDRPFCPRKP